MIKTLSNGFLYPQFFYLDNVHLVKNGNLKLAKSIFSLIENFDNVKHNNYIQFSKSYKMAVSFKFNNVDFPLLSCPSFSKSRSSVGHYRMLLHVIPCLIKSAYNQSIFLILSMNFFLWFPVFMWYVCS